MGLDLSIFTLASVLFGVLLIFLLLRSLRLPKTFFERQSERNALRQQLIIKNIEKEKDEHTEAQEEENHVS
jgi:hypothetical protein